MRFGPFLLTFGVLWSLNSFGSAQEPKRLELFLQTGHTESVTCVALSPDGKLLATGSDDGAAILWSADTGGMLQTFLGHTGNLNGVALSPDGKHLLTGSYDRSAILWDTATGKE